MMKSGRLRKPVYGTHETSDGRLRLCIGRPDREDLFIVRRLSNRRARIWLVDPENLPQSIRNNQSDSDPSTKMKRSRFSQAKLNLVRAKNRLAQIGTEKGCIVGKIRWHELINPLMKE
jgi:hypothetical protein